MRYKFRREVVCFQEAGDKMSCCKAKWQRCYGFKVSQLLQHCLKKDYSYVWCRCRRHPATSPYYNRKPDTTTRSPILQLGPDLLKTRNHHITTSQQAYILQYVAWFPN